MITGKRRGDFPRQPLDIINALLFGAVFVGIMLLVYYADMFFGERGLVVSGVMARLLDVDAITISMSKYAHVLKIPVAATGITAAMLSNCFFKFAVISARFTTVEKTLCVGLWRHGA